MNAPQADRRMILLTLVAVLFLVAVIFALTSGVTRALVLLVVAVGFAVSRAWKSRSGSRIARTGFSRRTWFVIAAVNVVVALIDFAAGNIAIGIFFVALAVVFGGMGLAQRGCEPSQPRADTPASPVTKPSPQLQAASSGERRLPFPPREHATVSKVASPKSVAHSTINAPSINLQFHWADGRLGSPQQNIPLSMLGLDRLPAPGALVRYAGTSWRVDDSPPRDVEALGGSVSSVYSLIEVSAQ
jgi:hypothetical protein